MRLMTAPEKTRAGIEDSMTRVRSHPLIKAMTKPPKNVATNWIKFPTCNKRMK
jgi:hypothetical protein